MNIGRQPYQGFTLAEIAIVLVIVGLLLGGLLIPLSAQVELRQRTENEKALADAREALIGFAIINGRLPCPANRTVATGAANAGLEATTAAGGPCACTAASSGIAGGTVACNETAPSGVSGVLPWATLGLPEMDAWNNRFSYRVTSRFGRVASGQTSFGCTPPTNPTTTAFALCSAGDITVIAAGGAPTANNLPAIVASHGKNGFGAWSVDGNQMPSGTATAEELGNADGDPNFFDIVNNDDQLIWISPNILMNRMIAAGRLP